jgi:uncharacterized DUF497 family protein
MELDQRPAVWLASNVKHIERDHPERGVKRAEVDEVLDDPRRLEYVTDRAGIGYHTVIGSTRAGRVLVVVWIDHPDGRFPVHARLAGRQAAKEYYR